MKNNPTRAQLNNDFSSCCYWMRGQLLYMLAQIIFFWEFMLELHYYLDVPVLLPIYYHTIRSCGMLLANDNVSLHSVLFVHLPTRTKWFKQNFNE